MLLFDQELMKGRKRSVRRRKMLSALGRWLLLLISVCAFGLLGGLTYRLLLIDREVTKLKQTVEDLHQEVRTNNPRKIISNVTGSGIANKVTDSKGNVFDVFIVDLNKTSINIYYEDNDGNRIGSFQRLKEYLGENRDDLVFATNGGMYTPRGTPVGLLIVNSKEIMPLDLKDGDPNENFYLKPNGVFVLTGREAAVMESSQFNNWSGKNQVTFATQSGPMLIINGTIHPKFRRKSSNGNIRSGVGIINSNQVVFAISENNVTFYDFALLFQEQFKCKNALYLDGAISRMYLPALQRYDLDGDFGGIIAVSK